MIDEKQQCKLRPVWLNKKHALSTKYPARVHAIKSTCKFTVRVPCLNAVYYSAAMKFRVNLNEIFRYPRAASLPLTFGFGTRTDNTLKISVYGKCKLFFAAFLCKASGNMQL